MNHELKVIFEKKNRGCRGKGGRAVVNQELKLV